MPPAPFYNTSGGIKPMNARNPLNRDCVNSQCGWEVPAVYDGRINETGAF